MDIQKFQEEHGALLVWALALCAVTFLVYTDKIPASTIEYLLAWAAGQAYSRRAEGKNPPPADAPVDNKDGQ